jgi:eukaryotic-like serine/threonine-protein kinase
MENSPQPNSTISHYRIISSLGAGGMGEVFLAEDTKLDRKVAIRVLPSESVADKHSKKRLLKEARAIAKVDHPNICAIYEVGEENGQSFIVMQYIEGQNLSARIKSRPLLLKETLDVATQVANALAEAGWRESRLKKLSRAVTPKPAHCLPKPEVSLGPSRICRRNR